MGLLVDGVWQDTWYDTEATGGRFERSQTQFHDQTLVPESGRYQLFVSYACPWAHRTLILRALKDLTDHIKVSVVQPYMGEHGWVMADDSDHTYLYELYTADTPTYTGRVTVPVLWDTREQRIVNNESAQIIRLFNSAFDDLTSNTDDYYPKSLRAQIDAINDYVYEHVNNGVYRCGFATTQAAYEEAVVALFEALDTLEATLAKQPYLVEDTLTEADWRLFTTLVRFDAVYVGHFKCSIRRLVDYPHLWRYTCKLYQHPRIAQTVHFDHIKAHYYQSHPQINPTGIVPVGPALTFDGAL